MSQKKTLQEKLSKRKYKVPNRLLYNVLSKFVIGKMLEPKYNVHYEIVDDINKEKGPCFLIFNHQSRIDYVWTVRAAYPRRLNFVVGYNEFFRSHLHLILKIANAIPKKNFTIDLPAMRGIDSIIKQGGVVCFSPEGMSSISGHNQPIVPSTGKLFKHYGVPVYMVKTEGAFLTNTKVCLDERKGRINAKMVRLFTKEDLQKLSDREIDEKINEALWQDDYEWNLKEKVSYETNGRICEHLSDLLYRCPKCGHEFEMESGGDKIVCKHCGNGATMDDTYAFRKLHEDDVIPSTPTRWFDEERKEVYRELSKNPDYVFECDVKLGALPKYRYLKDKKTSEIVGAGRLRVDKNGVHYIGTRDNKPFSFDISYKTLPTYGMPTDMTYIALYDKNEYFDLYPAKPVVGKLLLVTEEFARLTENTWPNFPWMKWVYEKE